MLRASRPCGLPHMSPSRRAPPAQAAASSGSGRELGRLGGAAEGVLGGGHTFQSSPDPSGDDPAVTSNCDDTKT